MERNIALKLMYNGTAYHGWQVQKNAVSVAETLEKALSTVVCHPVKCTGAGRTDAGVHAEVYVANFRTTSTIPCDLSLIHICFWLSGLSPMPSCSACWLCPSPYPRSQCAPSFGG